MSWMSSPSGQAGSQSLDHGAESVVPRLSLAGIRKAFSGVDVLQDIDLEVRAGEVVALLGENGAGKSTLSAIIAGLIPPSAGTMTFEGKPYAPTSPRAAIEAGIGLIHQEARLVQDLTIAENVFIGCQPSLAWRVDRAFMRVRTQELLLRLGVDVSPDRLVRTLSVARQQQVEIARALNRKVRLMILDEPTAPLGGDETERLFAQLKRLRADGVSIIYISHRLGEIARIADRILVLRDGHRVAEYASADVPVHTVLRDMVGRSVGRLFPVVDPPQQREVLRAEGLTSASDAFHDICFCVNAGEIFGLAGTVGAGRTRLVRSIVGADPLIRGHILLDGKPQHISGPADAIRAGIVLVPVDRNLQGVIGKHSVADNLTLGNFDKVGRRGWFQPTAQFRFAQGLIDQVGIKCHPGQLMRYLSGGNQQKTMIARWIAREPKVFILDEPTRGIDVGARAAIYRLIVELARTGVAVLIVSSDIEEVLGMSHRVLVMSRGRQMGVFNSASISAMEAMELATK